jgi:hypothetical protein
MATVTRSQSIMIVEADSTDVDAESLARSSACCAYIKGIPPFYAAQAQAEGWFLPYIIVETWEEEVPA